MKNLNQGAHRSPNIQTDSDIYELENRACDPENKIERFLETQLDWKDKLVLDIGCGTGFHLPFYAQTAAHVFGVEPHDDSRLKAMRRCVRDNLSNVSIVKGTAESICLEDNLIDFAYARFAYFWGKGSEKGLQEVFRVLREGGSFVMIDNNLERGTFGGWVKRSFGFSDSHQEEVEKFWSDQGFLLQIIDSEWRFETREELEKVLRIEFPEAIYEQIITEHSGLRVDYSFNLYCKTKS